MMMVEVQEQLPRIKDDECIRYLERRVYDKFCVRVNFERFVEKAMSVRADVLSLFPDPQEGRVCVQVRPDEEATKDLLMESWFDFLSRVALYGSDVYLPTFSAEELYHNKLECSYDVRGVTFRPGRKLTRAIKDMLELQGRSEVAEAIASRWAGVRDKVFGHTGWLVVSANPVDILMMSEECGYTSCHSVGGQYSTGTVQYALMPEVWIAYYFERIRDGIPYKLWRRLLYLDIKRGNAVFSRLYGNEYLWVQRKAEDMVIDLLKIRGKKYEVQVLYGSPAEVLRGVADEHFYMDVGHANVHIKSSPDKVVLVPARVECLVCSYQRVETGTFGLCASCVGESMVCSRCGSQVDEGISHVVDGELLCSYCFDEDYVYCERCGDVEYRQDSYVVYDQVLCERCFNRLCTRCDKCDEPLFKEDATMVVGYEYCPGCVEEYVVDCEECGKLLDRDEDALEMWNGGYLCNRCASLTAVMCQECELYVLREDSDEEERCPSCAERHAKARC